MPPFWVTSPFSCADAISLHYPQIVPHVRHHRHLDFFVTASTDGLDPGSVLVHEEAPEEYAKPIHRNHRSQRWRPSRTLENIEIRRHVRHHRHLDFFVTASTDGLDPGSVLVRLVDFHAIVDASWSGLIEALDPDRFEFPLRET
jgi:hypothetical protein